MNDTLPEDIQAASDFATALANCKTGAQLAKCHAKNMGIELTEKQLNKALSKFGTSLAPMDECVKYAISDEL